MQMGCGKRVPMLVGKGAGHPRGSRPCGILTRSVHQVSRSAHRALDALYITISLLRQHVVAQLSFRPRDGSVIIWWFRSWQCALLGSVCLLSALRKM